ncbi:MAG: hypothetical protein MMC33_010341 [Icmadophila ericetorum]|nr:hypothetical protein [Icmadophila ericetorum]
MSFWLIEESFRTNPSIALSENEAQARRNEYLKALQSERFSVYVGSEEKLFAIPKDFLTMHSALFKAMCDGQFKEAVDRVIKLPEDDPCAFEAFLCLANLAVFTDTYQIIPLKNQISEAIRFSLAFYKWYPTPALIQTIYSGVAEGSIFRKLCYMGFVNFLPEETNPNLPAIGPSEQELDFYTQPTTEYYAIVLEQIPDFAFDYFKLTHNGTNKHENLATADICAFHDHSDVQVWALMENYHKETTPRIQCPHSNGLSHTPFPLQLPLPICETVRWSQW